MGNLPESDWQYLLSKIPTERYGLGKAKSLAELRNVLDEGRATLSLSGDDEQKPRLIFEIMTVFIKNPFLADDINTVMAFSPLTQTPMIAATGILHTSMFNNPHAAIDLILVENLYFNDVDRQRYEVNPIFRKSVICYTSEYPELECEYRILNWMLHLPAELEATKAVWNRCLTIAKNQANGVVEVPSTLCLEEYLDYTSPPVIKITK